MLASNQLMLALKYVFWLAYRETDLMLALIWLISNYVRCGQPYTTAAFPFCHELINISPSILLDVIQLLTHFRTMMSSPHRNCLFSPVTHLLQFRHLLHMSTIHRSNRRDPVDVSSCRLALWISSYSILHLFIGIYLLSITSFSTRDLRGAPVVTQPTT